MVHGVAHGMGERVPDRLQQALVQSRLLPLKLNADLPPAGCRQIADQAGKLAEEIAHRLHAGLHHTLAQLCRHAVQPARKLWKVLLARRTTKNLVARQHQIAHQVHYPVQYLDIDAQRLVLHRWSSRHGHPRCSRRQSRQHRIVV